MARKILVIEDDPDIAHLLEYHLQDAGHEVTLASHGQTGFEQATSKPFDLIVLDLILPGLEGLEICRRLRTQPNYIPILMLTAKTTELDRVLGLEVGADDYLTKPFSIREILARVKALFRRIDALHARRLPEPPETIRTGELSVDVEKRRVLLGERSVELTAKEFDLLLHFARHPGRVYSRAQLLDLVWGYGHEGYEHTVNSHINRLRGKIERDVTNPRYILTVWGVGYKFVEPEQTKGA